MSVTLLAVGDLMLGRYVAAQMPCRDAAYPFGAVRRRLAEADVVFGNLESPLYDDGTTHYASLRPTFSAPTLMAERLALAGFTVLSLANNHVLDQGPEGLSATRNALHAVGIRTVGVIESLSHAQKPVIVERNGVRIGFLAYSMWAKARKDTPGAVPAATGRILSEVRALRGAVDVVCVSIHSGYEWASSPNFELLLQLRRLLRSGISVVLGHHPHVPQGVITAHRAVAFCSLGNFVSDMHFADITHRCHHRARADGNPFAEVQYDRVRTAMLARVVLDRSGVVGSSASFLRISDDGTPHQEVTGGATELGTPSLWQALGIDARYHFRRVRTNPRKPALQLARRLKRTLRQGFRVLLGTTHGD
jgi:hypothetical protein